MGPSTREPATWQAATRNQSFLPEGCGEPALSEKERVPRDLRREWAGLASEFAPDRGGPGVESLHPTSIISPEGRVPDEQQTAGKRDPDRVGAGAAVGSIRRLGEGGASAAQPHVDVGPDTTREHLRYAAGAQESCASAGAFGAAAGGIALRVGPGHRPERGTGGCGDCTVATQARAAGTTAATQCGCCRQRVSAGLVRGQPPPRVGGRRLCSPRPDGRSSRPS
jgi:hypothetical protein